MAGKFHPLPLGQLLSLIINELNKKGSIFGIPDELFFVASHNKSLKSEIFGHPLQSPLGPAAGPHTQMAQNIVAAWLMGARYIELKTVQHLDDLDIPRPCIDMQDEGYNCEWSQELTVRESFSEYLNAWIIIHLLNHRLGRASDPGTVFNMSVGYDLKGITGEKVGWFFDKMNNCSEELSLRKKEIYGIYPEAADIVIPEKISDNVTLSTMHGCPADEIEEIAAYLMRERRLHTLVKLNPTLLGAEQVRDILNGRLGFKTVVPDGAFAHDLKYADAVRIIKSLRSVAGEAGVSFGLKLTNTLESVNNKDVFGRDVSMMYMSGRALHPLSVNLAGRLQEEFGGDLLLSFSAGADAFNVSDLISCRFRTVTVCTDLLKPGGYMRLNQYFRELNKSLSGCQSATIDEYIMRTSGGHGLRESALMNLSRYSAKILDSKAFKRDYIKAPDIKSSRDLGIFDCISAPCRDKCAANQDVPGYLWHTSLGNFDRAFEVILRTNPFPSVTGMVCDHLCQSRCTRINYDDPVHIREVKRFISETKEVNYAPAPDNRVKVAIIGAGPSGLSCAFYLRLAGFRVDVFESKAKAGGMVQYAIPGFRLTDGAVEKDIDRIAATGVNIIFDSKVDRERFASLRNEYSYIFIGAGAQLSVPLDIEGADADGVTEPLQFLFRARQGLETAIGKDVVIIGGGNTAMDAARTAWRLVGEKGSVTVVYRRTVNEMPADQGEIKAVLEEGVRIIELAAPEKVIRSGNKVSGLLCSRIELRGLDKRGRPAPVKIDGSAFEISCDTIIPAIGQMTEIDFAGVSDLKVQNRTYRTGLEGVFIGGDAMRGASTAINAIGDGRKAAEEMMRDARIDLKIKEQEYGRNLTAKELIIRRSVRKYSDHRGEIPPEKRRSFTPVTETLNEKTIVREAQRCLWCDEMCSICTTVCPNFANRMYETDPGSIRLRKAVRSDDGNITFEDDGAFEVKQRYQILNVANFCNDCGNCNTFCPTSGSPYRDKPRFWLTVSSFNEADEGFYLAVLKDRKNLVYKHKGSYTTLTESSDYYIFENDFIEATFTLDDFTLKTARFRTPCVKEARFRQAAEMALLLKGSADLLF
ncbi:MAG: putative selenate reductase subunit YgfK [Bacteroidales bacterium]|nr:putative selenate reductase subunit YgfK [Bacteroidales bacterium]